jgi:8-oxo-dGTP pyrophosphatase MutT (NUDIX family)
MLFKEYINSLKIALQKPLPGNEAQFKMAPNFRKDFPNSGIPEKASVLLLLYPVDNKPYIVFIKRTEYQGAHSNQISFPGGKYEDSDITIQTTAIRETQEELGNQLDGIEIIGCLSTLLIPVSGYEVHPFVGYLNYYPGWNPDPKEVSYLIETPVELINDPETKTVEIWNFEGIEREVPIYKIKNEKIWGATAMILSEFETISKINC